MADLLTVADEKQFAVLFPKLKDHGERAIPLLASQFGPAPVAPAVKTDWTVRFYKWNPVGRPLLGISDFYIPPGARIASILQDGAAQRAGLKPHDAILAVGGKNTTVPRDVYVEVQKYKIGDKWYSRSHARATMDVEVTLAPSNRPRGLGPC